MKETLTDLTAGTAPPIVSPATETTFASLNLCSELLRALESAGYRVPTPIQAQAIPPILAGQDVLAAAQTGTGKTAGFVLPILQRLMGRENREGRGRKGPQTRRPVRALILTPTRELAAQVEESVRTYGRFLPLSSYVLFGGVSMTPQFKALARGVDILVATPGRLLDHLGQRSLDLSQVEILVLDEADRMLDMGFIRDIRRILAQLPQGCQNLLFSATFSDEIKALADELLNAPQRVEVARQNEESALVTQSMYGVAKENKRAFLVWLMAELKMQQVLIFTRTKHGADRLTKQLMHDGISAVAIHGNRSQAQRTQALLDFKAGRVRALVATDVAARGLDIQQLPHVINFEIPNIPEDYVHRIGRTGRAGSTGDAISLVSPDERKYLVGIEKLIGKKIERRSGAGFIPPVRQRVAPDADPMVDVEIDTDSEREPEPTPAAKPTGERRPKREPLIVEFPGRSRGKRPQTRAPRHKRHPVSPSNGGSSGGPRPGGKPRLQRGSRRSAQAD